MSDFIFCLPGAARYQSILQDIRPRIVVVEEAAEARNFKLEVTITLLAHLSRRLTGELIVYPCSGVRPSSSVVRRPSSVVHNFKDLLL